MSKRLFAITLMSLLLLLSACQPVAPQPPVTGGEGAGDAASTPMAMAEPDLAVVRVGHLPITIYAPLFVADGKGYFADEGIDVELIPTQGGTENVVQLAAGNFDVAGGGIGAGMWNAAERGIDFEIVLPLHTERPPLTTPFVVSKARFDSGELTSMAAMAGKKVSTNSIGSGTEYWLWRALQQGGLDFEDVEVLGIGFGEVAAALESGSLDGGMLAEPLATLAADQGLVHKLGEDFLDGVTVTVLYYNTEWSAANPELAQGFARAFLRGARDLNGASWAGEENLAIIEEYTGVPAAIVARANRSYHDPNGQIPVTDLETLQQFFAGQGQLSYDGLLDVNEYINGSYVEAALESLGGAVEWE